MAPKIDAKSMKNRGCVADAFLERPLGAKGGVRDTKSGPIWRPFSTKRHQKRHTKIDVEKVCEIMRTCSKNDAKTRSQIDGKSMKFRNLRFLVSCEEYNVKIVFLHDQGSQYRPQIH